MDRFLAVGGLQQDFRKEGAQETADIPSPVREFESLVEEGKGENGAGVHLNGEARQQSSELGLNCLFRPRQGKSGGSAENMGFQQNG